MGLMKELFSRPLKGKDGRALGDVALSHQNAPDPPAQYGVDDARTVADYMPHPDEKFHFGDCSPVTYVIAERALADGVDDFSVVHGPVSLDGRYVGDFHTWLERDGVVLDPTVTQFGEFQKIEYHPKRKQTPGEYVKEHAHTFRNMQRPAPGQNLSDARLEYGHLSRSTEYGVDDVRERKAAFERGKRKERASLSPTDALHIVAETIEAKGPLTPSQLLKSTGLPASVLNAALAHAQKYGVMSGARGQPWQLNPGWTSAAFAPEQPALPQAIELDNADKRAKSARTGMSQQQQRERLSAMPPEQGFERVREVLDRHGQLLHGDLARLSMLSPDALNAAIEHGQASGALQGTDEPRPNRPGVTSRVWQLAEPPQEAPEPQVEYVRGEGRRNAPRGGFDYGERKYRAGQFIPGDVMFLHTPPRGNDGSTRMKPDEPTGYADAIDDAQEDQPWSDPTETERAAFEASIDANPLDSTNHAVYADWLDEHGDFEEADFRRKMGDWLQHPELTSLRPVLGRDFMLPWRIALQDGRQRYPDGVNQEHMPHSIPPIMHDEFPPHHPRMFHVHFNWQTYRDMEQAFRIAHRAGLAGAQQDDASAG